MPEPIVAADASPAVSSPAVDLAPVAPPDRLAALSEAELRTWRQDGTFPSTSPVTTPPADSSPAPAVQDQPASTDAPVAAASEPAWTPAALKAETKKRFDELLATNARERERADRAEQRARDRPQPLPDARPAASSAAPAGPIAPDPETFPFGTADPGYLAALSTFTVQTTLAGERAKWDAGQREAQSRAEHDRVMAAFDEKAAAARIAHPDFDDIAMKATTLIPPGSLADLFVLENKADAIGVGGAEILYHLQQPANRAEQARILALPTMDQFIALVRLGDRLKGGAAASTTTSVPPPPPTLSTRATPGDPVERALHAGDYGAYKRAADARELAARRK